MFETLYRKNSKGNVTLWRVIANPASTGQGEETVTIEHGQFNGKLHVETIPTHRSSIDEAKSRFKAKIKEGYKTLADIKDNNQSPVEGQLESYLLKYLPDNRTTGDGSLLPMLAKAFDNTNNRLFKNDNIYLGQWKINGLRCFIRAEHESDGLFEITRFTFQSREGTYWDSLQYLNDYLLNIIPSSFIKRMIDENIILDGELYIPGFSVNELNHHIKNSASPFNKFVQFWCYDLYIEDTTQAMRNEELIRNFFNFRLKDIKTKEDHFNVKSLFNVLPNVGIDSGDSAIEFRDKFINLGFEGLIMRPLDIEYSCGKRHMIKFKKATDGIFTIVDIIPEGIRRSDLAKFVCKNDINDEEFECKLSSSLDIQRACLKNKDKLIGENLFIEYGERSGVKQLPFHIKNVRFNNPTIYSRLN